jgi:hypothetical protein
MRIESNPITKHIVLTYWAVPKGVPKKDEIQVPTTSIINDSWTGYGSPASFALTRHIIELADAEIASGMTNPRYGTTSEKFSNIPDAVNTGPYHFT